MRKQKKIDSTEELLDIIREDASAVSPSASADGTPSSAGKAGKPAARRRAKSAVPKRLIPRMVSRPQAKHSLWGGMRRSTVAIDLHPDCLIFVKMLRRDVGGEIQEMERIPLEEPGPDDAALGRALRAVSKRLHRGDKVWSVLRTGDMDINVIRIPKVPAARVADTVYWQLQKERKFDDAEYVLDYRVIGSIKDNGVSKIEVMTCLAKRSEVERVKALFQSSGIELCGLVPIPNAYQNVYAANWCDCGGGICANVHVDTFFSCISIHSSKQLQFTRTIKSGTASMAEELMQAGARQQPAAPEGDLPGPEGDLEGPSLESAPAARPAEPVAEEPHRDLVRSLNELRRCLCGQDEAGGGPTCRLERPQALELVTPAVDRIARQVERTLDYHYSRTQQRCDRLHLSGEIFACPEIRDMIADQLGMEFSLFDPIAGSGQVTAQATLASENDRLPFAEAIAACLGDEGKIVNLSRNYRERARDKRHRLIDNAVSLGFLILVLAAALTYVVGGNMLHQRRVELQQLHNELAGQPVLNADVLRGLAGKESAAQKRVRAISRRYAPLSVLAELSSLAPENMRFLDVNLVLGASAAADSAKEKGKAKTAGAGASDSGSVVLEAIVTGKADLFDSTLTRFLLGLKGSPLFADAVVEKNDVETFNPDGDVLHCILRMPLKGTKQ